MTFDDYQKAAARTSGESSDIINGALGIGGEAGEVIELVKKHKYHGRDLDLDALAKELGDLMWYLAETASQAGLSLSDVAAMNVEKLQKRHPDGFSADYKDKPDVLAGYEWHNTRLYAPGASRDLFDFCAIHIGDRWYAYDMGQVDEIDVASGRCADPKGAAEAALRAHLEAKL